MDAAQVLRELWRRRLWVGLAVVVAVIVATFVAYRVSFTPAPTLESKSFEYGSAVTEVVLDAPFAPLIDVRGDLEPLAVRAQAYSRLIRTPDVLLGVAERLNIPPASITALAAGAGEQEERSARLVAEERQFRLSTASESGLPVITVFVQAPSADEAIAFADGVIDEFGSFLKAQQEAREVPGDARVQLRRLGPAQGGVVNEGADKTMVALALLGTFMAGCFLIVVVSGIVSGWHALSRAEQVASWEQRDDPSAAEQVGSLEQRDDPSAAEQRPHRLDGPHDNGATSADRPAARGVVRVPRSGHRG